MTGGGASDTLDGQQGVDPPDNARSLSLYDPLIAQDAKGKPLLALAESIESNSTATIWTINLRKGVTWHNGKPLTPADIIYSYRRIVANKLGGAEILAPCDVSSMRQVGQNTIQLPCHVPYPTFIEASASFQVYLNILPTGYDVHHPVGTGPFMYRSFTPGQTSAFVRNPNYWRSPYPYVDQLIIYDFADEASELDALASNQVDCVGGVSAISIPSARSQGARILISETGAFTPLTMRIDRPPLNDVRVRQALRLCVNRPEMRELVFGGHGLLGNDLVSPFDPVYDHSLPQRHQDIDQAKALLKQAGQDGMTLTLQASPIAPGTTQMTTVFAQQASAAGIKVNLDSIPTSTFFGPSYLQWPFAEDLWLNSYYIVQVAEAFLPTSPYNETHFNSPEYTRLYNEASTTVNPGRRVELCHEMQKIDYTEGGYIIPYFLPVIDLYAQRVHGATTSVAGGSFGDYAFAEMWLD